MFGKNDRRGLGWIVGLCLLTGALSCQHTGSGSRTYSSGVSGGVEAQQEGGTLRALLIGIDAYGGGIRPLKYAVRDVEAVREMLIRVNGLSQGQADAQIRVLRNGEATKQAIKGSFRTWLRREVKAKDTALIFFAGHGKDKDGLSYWVTADTEGTNLEEKGFSHEELNSEIGYLRTEKVLVFVDACHSGFGMRGMRAGADKALESFRFQGKGRVVLSSSRQSQESGEDDSLQHGFFTYALLEALSGKADMDRDGKVDLLETYRYLQKRVPALAMEKKNHKQDPVMHGTLSGEVLLARTTQSGAGGGAIGGGASSEGASGGRIRVESTPAGATVYVDGANEGKTPWEGEIGVGRRGLELRLEGYTLMKETIRVRKGQRRVLAYTLRTTTTDGATATVTPTVNPTPSTPKAGTRKTFTAGGETFAMRWIPAGSFTMGSPSEEAGRYYNEGSQRRIRISRGFWMLESEVTQGQYKALMRSNPAHFKKCGKSCPVEQVNWEDARAFANKLSAAQGLAACTPTDREIFQCRGWRLPTEAEWEYAARAGTTTAFHTGDCISTDQANHDVNVPQAGCPKGAYREKTIAVCSLAKNAWGLCDIHGNVSEWVMDLQGPYEGLSTQDPLRSTGPTERVLRGGSWASGARDVRSANRGYCAPSFRYHLHGFRLLRR